MYVSSEGGGCTHKTYEYVIGKGGSSKNVRMLKYFSNADYLKSSLNRQNHHLQLYTSSP